ncbi:agglutinin biogenesis protein MshN [Pseudoalteromonas sp. S3776]|uniref:tetratricopeptide repeat protein n=1 Tax=Pseudoalteromonas sp. S3776 TaxID=579544 RepID=UPI00110904BD|nr:tetratricopeptide repeat protein [Pseudoalteromonas sp. S3776]TMO80148.1 agglutinin biogenesis protein MshN [Pseudoalteromonas sp. S3776]
MSVINNMLKNIDQRQNAQRKQQSAGVAITPVRDYHDVLFKVLSVLLAIVIIFTAYLYLPFAQAPQPSSDTAEKAHAVKNSSQPVEIAQAKITPVIKPLKPLNEESTAAEAAYTPAVAQKKLAQEQSNNALLKQPKDEVIQQHAVEKDTLLSKKNSPTETSVKVAASTEINAPLEAKSSTPVKSITQAEQPPVENKLVKTASVKQSKAQRIAQQLKRAKQALEFALYDDAINDLTAILQTQPEHIEARNLLAATYFQQQDVLMAQQLLVAGIKINPEVVQWRTMLSKILIMQQEYEGVLKLLIAKLEPQANLEFWILKGTAAQNAQQHQIALASFTQLTQLQPQQAKWWLALATSKDALGEFADAKHLYKVALDLGGLNAAMTQHALQRLVALKEAV